MRLYQPFCIIKSYIDIYFNRLESYLFDTFSVKADSVGIEPTTTRLELVMFPLRNGLNKKLLSSNLSKMLVSFLRLVAHTISIKLATVRPSWAAARVKLAVLVLNLYNILLGQTVPFSFT